MRITLGIAAACVMGLTMSASAHHSHGQYEETFSDIQGTVKEMHLLTPHSWVYIEVKDASGATKLWALEGTNRPALEKIGITRDYVKPGDTIKARCHPLRDKNSGCLLGFLQGPGWIGEGLGRRQRPRARDF